MEELESVPLMIVKFFPQSHTAVQFPVALPGAQDVFSAPLSSIRWDNSMLAAERSPHPWEGGLGSPGGASPPPTMVLWCPRGLDLPVDDSVLRSRGARLLGLGSCFQP